MKKSTNAFILTLATVCFAVLVAPPDHLHAQQIKEVRWSRSPSGVVSGAVDMTYRRRPHRVLITVDVGGLLGGKWVGGTYYLADDSSVDMEAQSVSILAPSAEFLVPGTAERMIVALWHRKIEDSDWDMGYYMDGRIDRVSFSLSTIWRSKRFEGRF